MHNEEDFIARFGIRFGRWEAIGRNLALDGTRYFVSVEFPNQIHSLSPRYYEATLRGGAGACHVLEHLKGRGPTPQAAVDEMAGFLKELGSAIRELGLDEAGTAQDAQSACAAIFLPDHEKLKESLAKLDSLRAALDEIIECASAQNVDDATRSTASVRAESIARAAVKKDSLA